MIGIFDSGFGGLTVVRALLDQPALARYHYRYLGDSLHAPYGDKSVEEIFQRLVGGVTFLFEQGCPLVIVACNSASAKALPRLQQEWLPRHYPNYRVLGVIRPVAETIARTGNNRAVGILATAATVESNAYATEINRLNPNITVVQRAAPQLVPLIEAGNGHGHEEITAAVHGYLQPLLAQRIDVLVPACTHYPLIAATISAALPPHVPLLDTGAAVAHALTRYLSRHPELRIQPASAPAVHFFTTGDARRFVTFGTRFLQQPIEHATTVTLYHPL